MMEIIHTSFLNPVFEGSVSSGVNYRKLAKQTDLKYFDYTNENCYITMDTAQSFMSYFASREGIDDLALEYSPFIKATALECFGDLFSVSQSILDFLGQCEKMSSAVISSEKMKLRINGNKAVFYNYIGNLNPASYDLVMQVNLMYLLNTFDFMTRDGWQPDELHFQTSLKPQVLDLFPHFIDTKILLEQPMTAIVFDAVELAYCYNKTNEIGQPAGGQCIGEMRNKVELLIDSYALEFGAPNISNTAYLLGTSERTLRRKLAQEGCSFGELLSSWRLRKSVQLLQNPSVCINEIATRLHYRQANNFTRAFKNTFGNSPREFRDNISSTPAG